MGTSTNIIVSQIRSETLGKPFLMFDFAPVGLVLTALGLVFVSVGWRLLPRDRRGTSGMDQAVESAPYATEAVLPKVLPEDIKTVADLKLSSDGVALSALVRGEDRQSMPLPDASLQPGDILVLTGPQENLGRVIARTPLLSAREGHDVKKDEPSEEMRSVEAVITDQSVLVGRSAQRLRLKQQYGVNLLAVGRADERITERLRDVTLRAGDVLVLQAGERALPEVMKTLGRAAAGAT